MDLMPLSPRFSGGCIPSLRGSSSLSAVRHPSLTGSEVLTIEIIGGFLENYDGRYAHFPRHYAE